MYDHGTFGYLELNADFDIDLIAQFILDGCIDNNHLVIIRNLHGPDICKKLSARFDQLIREEGSERGEDGFVRTQQIGSSQFHKNGLEYMKDTIRQAPRVLELFAGLSQEIVGDLFLDNQLETAFVERGLNYRPAKQLSGSANFATTRKWLNNGEMALHPHDDGAQLAFAAEDGFEIAGGNHTIAVNFCIADDENGSELVLWDLRPDNSLRERFGVEKTGYPYPLDFVNSYDSMKVKVRAGDLYFMNASFVHGVENSDTNFRITSGRFITSRSNKVVYWT